MAVLLQRACGRRDHDDDRVVDEVRAQDRAPSVASCDVAPENVENGGANEGGTEQLIGHGFHRHPAVEPENGVRREDEPSPKMKLMIALATNT
jgi:hypothetical protein